jgi:hypothetical protein
MFLAVNATHLDAGPRQTTLDLYHTEGLSDMADSESPSASASEAGPAPSPMRSKDEVALDLMKFIAVTTGYGKPPGAATGFSAKPGTRSPEEQAEALLELFRRCRQTIKEEN